MNNHWKEVREALEDIQNIGAYYAGGTLSVPLPDRHGYKRGIALNLDGTGFIMVDPKPWYFKNARVYQPPAIRYKVQALYLKYKGCTEHFLSSQL